ncbi:MAG: DNA repair protein RadA [Limnochordales bacterium]|nr:DNA repair protein RadA [Limnochordales bacterium]
MPAVKAAYVCQVCGQTAPKWQGRCHACGSWNSFTPVAASVSQASAVISSSKLLRALKEPQSTPVIRSLAECVGMAEPRWPTGLVEFDRVLGGGVVPGSVILLGGEPGIGKSTLLLQAGERLARQGRTVLYVAGEESAAQVASRAERVGATAERFYLLNRNALTDVFAAVGHLHPDLVLVDSLQTVFDPEVDAPPGSLAQVRQVAVDFVTLAKEAGSAAGSKNGGGSSGPAVLLVGHVTKSGLLAGPKVVEHIVDVVLSFEGEKRSALRLLRATKNRFGSTQEVGIFQMGERGLDPVADPSQTFLGERPKGAPGSVVLAAMEGHRPVMVEVQALVTPAPFGGTPRRLVTGVDPARAGMVLAVLEKRAGLNLATMEVYVNVAGGMLIDEPAADLAIALAVVSGFRSVPVPADMAVAGEIGLTGEVRSINLPERRLAEAARAGFRRLLLPAGNVRRLPLRADIEVEAVGRLEEALGWVER